MNNYQGTKDQGTSKDQGSNASASTSSKSESRRASRGDAGGTMGEMGSEKHGVDIRKYLDDARSMGKSIEGSVSSKPMATLGAVAGASFLAGAILGSRVGQLAVAIGLGYAATRFFQESDIDVKDVARTAASKL